MERKRRISLHDDDDESLVKDRKRMRQSLDSGAAFSRSSRSHVSEVTKQHDLAGKVNKIVASPVGGDTATEVVKRGRGRPRKVSALWLIIK